MNVRALGAGCLRATQRVSQKPNGRESMLRPNSTHLVATPLSVGAQLLEREATPLRRGRAGGCANSPPPPADRGDSVRRTSATVCMREHTEDSCRQVCVNMQWGVGRVECIRSMSV